VKRVFFAGALHFIGRCALDGFAGVSVSLSEELGALWVFGGR